MGRHTDKTFQDASGFTALFFDGGRLEETHFLVLRWLTT